MASPTRRGRRKIDGTSASGATRTTHTRKRTTPVAPNATTTGGTIATTASGIVPAGNVLECDAAAIATRPAGIARSSRRNGIAKWRVRGQVRTHGAGGARPHTATATGGRTSPKGLAEEARGDQSSSSHPGQLPPSQGGSGTKTGPVPPRAGGRGPGGGDQAWGARVAEGADSEVPARRTS